MKKLLFLLLVSFQAIAQQNIVLQENEIKVFDTYGFYNITFAKNSKVYVYGEVIFANVNQFENSKIEVAKDAKLTINSSLNCNGNDSVLVYGKLVSKSIEIQNKFNYLKVQGGDIKIDGDLQLSNNTSEIDIIGGKIFVSNWFHINNSKEGAVTFKGCGEFEGNLSVNSNNSVDGEGTLKIYNVNLNQRFSNSDRIFVKYTGDQVNNKQWGKAQINSTSTCEIVLPVHIVSFNAKTVKSSEGDVVEYEIILSEDSTPMCYTIQLSNDEGKTWENVFITPIKMNGVSKKYTGTFKK